MTSAVREKLVCMALALATLAAFGGAHQCEFVNYDDPAYITSNQEIQHGLTAQSVKWAFTTGAASNWHPLTWLSHIVDVQLYGMNPAGHHMTSVLLHAVNAVLLFLILRRMTGAFWRCAVVAGLFALHPLRVESVAWVSERKDVLSTLFWMLTVWAYVCYARCGKPLSMNQCRFQSGDSPSPQPSPAGRGRSVRGSFMVLTYYALALTFFALGLMSKPMLVTLPFVLLLLDYWPLNRIERGWMALVKEKIPFFAMAVVSSVVTFVVQREGGAVSTLTGVPIGARIGNTFVSYVRYIAKIFWPARLSPLYPHPGYWPWWQIAGSIVILAAITVWVIKLRRTQPYLVVGWLWFLGMLAPTIGIVQVGIQSMADRYSYVPSVGFFIMLVWGANEWIKSPRWVLSVASALALGLCLLLTPRQVGFWRNSETLFQHAVAVTDKNYLAYNNLGFDLSNRGQTERSMFYFQKALEINSNYDEAHNNLGYALAQLGRYQEATNEYIKALSLNPNLTEAHNNLGIALGHVGQAQAGIHEYKVALQENPHHAGAHNNLGVALAMEGKLDEAIAQFRLSASCQENYLSAHSDLGNALAIKGDLAGAIQEYEFCLRLDPKDPQVHNNLGNALAQQNRLEEAVTQYRQAVELQPVNPEAHFNLAICLLRQGKNKEAEEQCAIALQQRPDYAEARKQLEALKAASQKKLTEGNKGSEAK